MKRIVLAGLLALPLLALTETQASAFFSVCGKYNTNVNLKWQGCYNFTMPKVYFGLEWAPKPCAAPAAPCIPLPWDAAFPPQYYLALRHQHPHCPPGGQSYGQGGGGGCPGGACGAPAATPHTPHANLMQQWNAMQQAGYRPMQQQPVQQPVNNYYNPTGASVPSYWYGR